MFTGIVEEIGFVTSLKKTENMKLWDGSDSEGTLLVVKAEKVMDKCYIGCSISVNGTCLTVTAFEKGSFSVGLSPETMRCTNLGNLKTGDAINLERGMKADDRNSGHFVQGHVDGTGEIKSFKPEGDSLWVAIEAPSRILRYIIPKGYICVDGVSLTVCTVVSDGENERGWFNLMLIPHTQQSVTLPTKSVGDLVNLEADCIGKYVEKSHGVLLARISSLEEDIAKRFEEIESKIEHGNVSKRQRVE